MTKVVIESGTLEWPAIVVHGGAGEFARRSSPADLRRLEDGLSGALAAGWQVLTAGGRSLDAVVEAVSFFESSGIFNAGRGAVATSRGTVETDAAVMDGKSGAVGAICSASFPESPVRAARRVMDLGGPAAGPILLAGRGADWFCEQAGLSKRDPASLLGEGVLPLSSSGTVGAVAVDSGGHLAAATSTGGRLGKLPGRVGDSPVPGAGTWADDRTVAVSATGEGESFLVTGFAHRVNWAVSGGAGPESALGDALEAVRAIGGHGGAIAITNNGGFSVVFDTSAMARAWRDARTTMIRPIRKEGSGPGDL